MVTDVLDVRWSTVSNGCCMLAANFWLFILVWVGGDSSSLMVLADTMKPVYWNSSNPIFRIDNSDHVRRVQIRDKVTIYCPNYGSKAASADAAPIDSDTIEYSKIYRVPRWSYDRCVLTKHAQLLGVCRNPFDGERISLVFRTFTPLPNGLEFTAGHSYYFISTSNGSQSGLNKRKDGLCLTKNMKLIFEVHETEGANSHAPLPPKPDQRAGKDPSDRRGGGRTDAEKARGGMPWPSRHSPLPGGHPNASTDSRRLRNGLADAASHPSSSSNDGGIRGANDEQYSTTTPIWYVIHTYPPSGTGGDGNEVGHGSEHDENGAYQGYKRNNDFSDISDESSTRQLSTIALFVSAVIFCFQFLLLRQ